MGRNTAFDPTGTDLLDDESPLAAGSNRRSAARATAVPTGLATLPSAEQGNLDF